MKSIFFLTALLTAWQLGAQNTGIGITNPIRGKLEVQGTGNTVTTEDGDREVGAEERRHVCEA